MQKKTDGNKVTNVRLQARQARLVELVGQLLGATNIDVPGTSRHRWELALGRYVGAISDLANPRVEELAEEILSLLGANHGFQGSWEVIIYCIDWIPLDAARLGTAAVEALVASHLQDPLREYELELAYPTVARFPLDWTVRGPQPVRLQVLPDKEKSSVIPSALRFLGSVKARTEEGAVLDYERLLDAVLGVARTIDIARFLDTRSLVSFRPEVEVKSASASGSARPSALPIATVYGDRLASLVFGLPRDLSQLERTVLDGGDLTQALARHRRAFSKALAGTSQRAEEVRNACRLAINAEHSLDFGVLVTLAFSCLEGLLLEPHVKDDVLARLAEAVAHSLGGNVEEKKYLRAKVKKLYDVRSQFVHTGMARETAGGRQGALDLMYRVLRREIDLLPGGVATEDAEGR